MIAMLFKWEGISKADYDAVRKIVNWEGNKPKGAILHVATFDDKGLRVTDVWETAEDFNNFVNNRLMPGVAQYGVTTQPTSVEV